MTLGKSDRRKGSILAILNSEILIFDLFVVLLKGGMFFYLTGLIPVK